MSREITVRTDQGKWRQAIAIGPHRLVSDEPVSNQGEDAGPSPHELLLAALGSCTSMTVKVYADRKGWPLERVEVKVSGEHRDGAFVIARRVHLEGPLDDEQRQRLLEIAGKCPVHKTLTGGIQIESVLV